MNWDMVKGNWKQVKGRIKETWGDLTDDKLESMGGSRDRLVGGIQEQYGISRDEAERQMRDFERRYDEDEQNRRLNS